MNLLSKINVRVCSAGSIHKFAFIFSKYNFLYLNAIKIVNRVHNFLFKFCTKYLILYNGNGLNKGLVLFMCLRNR